MFTKKKELERRKGNIGDHILIFVLQVSFKKTKRKLF
jgi:hypothetical protein